MTRVVLGAPMAGWVTTLDSVQDPVFAERMMGDGLAIEPLSGDVVAPCDATVAAVAPTAHAVTLRLDDGAELLIHFGLDTVALGGDGFRAHVRAGERIAAGQRLLTADLDRVARSGRSAITPMVLINESHAIVPLALDRAVSAGEPVAHVSRRAPAGTATPSDGRVSRVAVRVPLVNGVHARPAARIAAALKPFAADVSIERGGRVANARSVTALLAAQIGCGEEVVLVGRGEDAEQALAAVAALIDSGMGERDGEAAPSSPRSRTGGAVRAAPGFAVGPVFQLRTADLAVAERGAGLEVERARLAAARARAGAMLGAGLGAGGIDDAHRALLDDPELLASAESLIAAGRSAGFAWRAVLRAQADRLRTSGNALVAERAADLRDVERQVVAAMTGAAPAPPPPPPGAIVIADELLPSQVSTLASAGAAGFCTAAGGPTSHAAILAASAGLPMVVAAGYGIMDLPDGQVVVLDADAGRLEPEPTPERATAAYAEALERSRVRATAVTAAQAAARTSDGARIEVAANLAGVAEAAGAVSLGAEGCGLLRTEFLFMDRRAAPHEDEQAATYAEVARALGGRPVIVRVLDVGGDKPLPYLPFPPEENPALGARGVRLLLARPDLLRTQLRAILRGVPLAQRRIMIPMVVDPGELRAARDILAEVAAELGVEPGPLGVMVETPAAALLADALAREADFLSVGSNDLTQYVLAADRGNPAVAAMIDPLHPAVLRLIAMAAQGARAHGRWLGVCGGVASEPAAAALLIGLGVTELSCAPAAIPAVKRAVAAVATGHARTLADRALGCATAAEVRALLGET